ncbi:MAG: (2Fe-2S)-binding protein [Rhodospirillaceae bacterium]|jgi:vanillate O-demethylase monooxygenase subunit|uniref:aromatic ring-hydroxylating dioxygenase subunit alpha n=1 Tax=Hwanghaeella sp. 1Z406 TaxID=3402811 RepID=UPI000C37C164|nr:(2Fe-2S)-binding protein [Rhodospirillales bacterium]MAX47714.1 (2Fe-2S)-binding protein [Rhodospirillaceae bacterium]|tara:strand:+ start:47654 stop:48697 length:1044 start_codon:yes stop_codon:yes gene_type:complete
MFLRNSWYVGAWSDEIDETPRQILMLNEKICVFRTQSGTLFALEDACPHRKLPLSMGRVKGEAIECGYHGLTFNCSGACIAAPGAGGRVPSNATVRSYPIEERYGLAWIWMGDPNLADPAKIFQIEHFDDPTWGINRGKAMEVDCNYLYITDNLLDPSHVAWVHQTSFAQNATRDTPLETDVQDGCVVVSRWMMDVEPAPFYKKIVEFEGNCDRLQHYEVRFPSHAFIRAVFKPAGTGGKNGPDDPRTFIMDSFNFMTPMTDGKTRYYWFQLRNVRPKDEALSKMMSEGVMQAFEEDRIILNAVQNGMNEKTNPNIDLAIDNGQLRFRKKLSQMIEDERKLKSVEAA